MNGRDESTALPLVAEDVARLTAGRIVCGDPQTTFTRVGLDSRAVVAGELFVAIVGTRFDGHDFVREAARHGAAGAIVRTGTGAVSGLVVIEVEDMLDALHVVGREVRRRSGTTVIAITGSAGKTTTKELTADLLALRYRTVRSPGNQNNQVGLPLSLLLLRERPEMAVLELGMGHRGQIARLVRTAEPDVRVWTNVGEAHLSAFDSVEEIADAKAEITEAACAGTVLVANADDPRVVARLGRFPGRVVTFGVESVADVRASHIVSRGLEGQSLVVTTPDGSATLDTPLFGRANLENLLAAVAVATTLGVKLEEVAERVSTLRPATHRGDLLSLGGGVRVIDDVYNSNPRALGRALGTLGESSGRRVAVLGEMLELGAATDKLHRASGEAVAAAGVAVLVTVGGDPARQLGDAARLAGLADDAVHHVADAEAAASLVTSVVEPGDTVLVKGSRGIGLERVVDRLKAELA